MKIKYALLLIVLIAPVIIPRVAADPVIVTVDVQQLYNWYNCSAEAHPKKICSQVGLCTFDGTRGVSAGIESVVDEKEGRSSGLHSAMCSACEMAVIWMQNQLRQNQTKDRILDYANQLCERLPSPMGESGVDCGSMSSMPIVSFTIVEKVFDLSPQEAKG